MTTKLVLEDFRAGSVQLAAGDRISSTDYDLTALGRAGLTSVTWDAATMQASLDAWLAQRRVTPDVSLADQLTADGVNPDTASKSYVDQPAARVLSSGPGTVPASIVGGTTFVTAAGAITDNLPDLSAALVPGKTMVLLWQCTGAATALTIDPGVGVTIDGAGANLVAPVGRSRVALVSANGLAWYSGTP